MSLKVSGTRCTDCRRQLLALWAGVLASLVFAGSTVAETRSEADQTPPPLSLETLYHPEKQYDYDGKSVSARWVEKGEASELKDDAATPTDSADAATAPQSAKLVVLREEEWMEVDLETGEEQPWELVPRLERSLLALEGVDQEKARVVAKRVAGKLSCSDQPQLARIGNGLAIVSSGSDAKWLTRDATSWNNPMLDPTGRWIGYTSEGDLFLQEVSTGRSLRLTDDASETLLDGILDWTYQEEIFGRGNYRAFWFSHDGNWLAMLRVDISQIEPYVLTGATSERGTSLVRRYSKAGDPIPHASLLVWDLRGAAASGKLPTPRRLEQSTAQQERIITGVWWDRNSARLLYSISDRLQSWRELKFVDETFLTGQSDESERLLREESPAWVEPPAAPHFLNDGSVVWTSELPSGRTRLYRVSADGGVVTPLTPRDFDVASSFVAADGTFALVTGDAEGGTVARRGYRIELGDDGTPAESMQRLTKRFGWHEVEFSPAGDWMIVRHSTPTDPPELYARPTKTAAGESAAEDTADAQAIPLNDRELNVPGEIIEPKLFRIATDDQASLPAMLVRPEAINGKLPVVIETYGGPGVPVVSARWAGKRSLYRQLLARRGIATLVVDNRSSAGRGIQDTWAIHNRVGQVELADLLEAVGWLKSQDWVDAERIALRGWSFGGFLTLYAMTHSEAFTAGIAGGSVTDWREYDSFYTERYMGLPEGNPAGYEATSPIAAAGNLHGEVLMIHGELDDNVHPSNTMRMVEALQSAGKSFELMIYPGASHGIHDPHQLWHMVRLTDGFLQEQLRGNGS